jgi:hypothetical protein
MIGETVLVSERNASIKNIAHQLASTDSAANVEGSQ